MYFTEGKKYNQRIKSDLCLGKDVSVLLIQPVRLLSALLCWRVESLWLSWSLWKSSTSAIWYPPCILLKHHHLFVMLFATSNACRTLMPHIEHGTNQHFPQRRPQQRLDFGFLCHIARWKVIKIKINNDWKIKAVTQFVPAVTSWSSKAISYFRTRHSRSNRRD